ncbi:MAG: YscO family type III secretion system apparatus protein [Puniceicoccales bacterium]|jgi:chromosome segregation ATPase|nr:YscO family type III secretion system apparatus protein [Puniceicoccales bacterium]
MKYELEDILKVRNFRKDKASDNVTKARRKLREAEEKVEEEKRKLEAFVQKKPGYIDLAYRQVIRRNLKRKNIDLIAFKITKLDERQMKLEMNIEKAQNERDKAAKHLAECQAILSQAMKDTQKIDEHKTTWMEEANQLEQELVEKEMEDFKAKKPSY